MIDFLEKLGISVEEYLENIGTKLRFATVLALYDRYLEHRGELLNALKDFQSSATPGRQPLVLALYSICEPRIKQIDVNLITGLLNKKRPRIKAVVNNARKFYSTVDINYLISTVIRLKTGYIEHTFYNRVSVIRFFMQKDNIQKDYLDILDDRILKTIELLYFSNIKHKKMLLDLGIYERDVDKIIKVIGDDFGDAFELKQRLADNISKLKSISYISKYVIQNIL